MKTNVKKKYNKICFSVFQIILYLNQFLNIYILKIFKKRFKNNIRNNEM